MTDRTNECPSHEAHSDCLKNLKRRADKADLDRQAMVPRWAFILFGAIVISFGLISVDRVDSKASQNTTDIKCLQTMAADIRAIKKVVVK